MHARVLDVLGTNACKCMHIMSAVLFLYAPQPSAEVSQRFAASIVIVGAPSPAHSKARNQTPPVADWDMTVLRSAD